MNADELRRICRSLKASLLIAALWTALFILDRCVGLMPALAGKGIGDIGGEYYRYATGPLLHFNLLHLLVNAVTVCWVGYYMEARVGSLRFFLFGLAAGTLAELLYALIFPHSQDNIGGSVWIFAYIGLIVVSKLFRPDYLPRFRLGTWYGNWIVAYAILGNIPFLSFMDGGTVVTHLIALTTGGVLGAGMLLFTRPRAV